MKQFKVEIGSKARNGLHEIYNFHLQKVGKNSAKNAVDKIFTSIERLSFFPLSCPLIQDEILKNEGYRLLICGDYICVYKIIEEAVYITNIVNGRTNYKNLLK